MKVLRTLGRGQNACKVYELNHEDRELLTTKFGAYTEQVIDYLRKTNSVALVEEVYHSLSGCRGEQIKLSGEELKGNGYVSLDTDLLESILTRDTLTLGNSTVLEQQIIKEEILSYLRAEQRLHTAIEEDSQRSVSFLHNKMLVIFNDLCRHYKISKSWLMDQINYNSENNILKTGGNVLFKSSNLD